MKDAATVALKYTGLLNKVTAVYSACICLIFYVLKYKISWFEFKISLSDGEHLVKKINE